MDDHDQAWNSLWKGIRELSDLFPDGVVFIGGIAVYLYAKSAHSSSVSSVPEKLVELSHDADLYIDTTDFASLRDLEPVTTNTRLRKSEAVLHGMSFDIYVEHRHGLSVSYADVLRASSIIDNVRVASLEHLLVLKLAAYDARRGTPKGRKDARDLIRILFLLSVRTPVASRSLLLPFLSTPSLSLLADVARSPEFSAVCGGNAHRASRLRTSVIGMIGRIEAMLKTTPNKRRSRR